MAQKSVIDGLVSEDILDIQSNFTELYAYATEIENARDGESTLLDQINTLQASITALLAGSGCPVSSDDTSAGYLDGKLVAGDSVDFTVGNPAGDETLTISSDAIPDIFLMGGF